MESTERASATVTANGLEGVLAIVGQPLGPTDWLDITQERVNTFADATDDHQWIHVDTDRAKTESPYKTTIAHGYLTLSLVPHFMPKLLEVAGFSMGINYGTDRVRFPAPVPVGSRLRGSLVVDEVTEITNGIQILVTMTIEIEGSAKPACAAVLVLRNYL